MHPRPRLRAALFALGLLLMLISPLVAIIPGPGGVPVFALGAGLALRNSRWAKKHYAALKRRWPKRLAWCDWALRRPSAKRRVALAKQTD